MKMIFAVVAVLSLSACGGPEDTGLSRDEDNRKISPDFAGEWSGFASLEVGGQAQGERPVTVNIRAEVNGSALDVSMRSLCGDEITDLHATGNGRATMWYGAVSCPMPLDECVSSRIDFSSAVLRVLEDGRFYLLLNGTATGCGKSSEALVEVYASR